MSFKQWDAFGAISLGTAADRAGWSRRKRAAWWVLTVFYLSGMALAAALGLTFLTVDWSTRLLRPELEPRPEYLAMAAFMGGVMFMAALPLGWGILRILFERAGRGKGPPAAGGAEPGPVGALADRAMPAGGAGSELAAVAAAEELEELPLLLEVEPAEESSAAAEPALAEDSAAAAAEPADGKADAV